MNPETLTDALYDQAVRLYGTDDVQIDDGPDVPVSTAEDGSYVWVRAWVRVPLEQTP